MREIFFVRGRAKLGFTVFYANGFTKENENRKRKRSLGCARDDETRKCLFPFLFIPRKPTSAPSGNAIKLSGRTFLAPHRGSCPEGLCKRTGFLGVKQRENPVRRHFERSEMRGSTTVYPTLFDDRWHAPIAFGTSPEGGSKSLRRYQFP